MTVTPSQKALGQKIRMLRAEKGYSQEGFADECGVHRTFMGTVERGESNLSFSNLLKISKTLGMPVSEMLDGVEKMAENLPPMTREKKHYGGGVGPNEHIVMAPIPDTEL